MASSASPTLSASGQELQQLLSTEKTTSVRLVEAFLSQIEKHNHDGLKLNAILSVCPRDMAIAQARNLDSERRAGRTRSKLHGLPIILKDAIVTDHSLGMVTSAGSYAIASLKAMRSATLVDKLVEAGLVILGKGNMTEFCGMKSDDTKIGWSAYGGQTLSPYRRDDLSEDDQPWCGGSSSGPAVSIAAGFSPLGIGTETGGSNVFPASTNGLYGMTLTHNTVPTDGVFKISDSFDRIGLMARDPTDIKVLAEILLHDNGVKGDRLSGVLNKSWEGLSIGVIESTWGVSKDQVEAKWGLPEVKARYNEIARCMKAKGARVIFPLDAPDSSVLSYGEDNLHTVAYNEFPSEVAKFIEENFEPSSNVKSLADIIAWNEQHSDQALPDPYTTQTELSKSLNGTMTDEQHNTALETLRQVAREEALAKTMKEQNLDVVLASSDSELVGFTSCAGWPVATVPVGNLEKNGQPWGMFVLARAGREDVLLRFMAAFKETFEPVQKPTRPFE